MAPRMEQSPNTSLYHSKAREMMKVAESVADPAVKRQLVMLAISYEVLADRAYLSPWRH